jgi:hypothetical protein
MKSARSEKDSGVISCALGESIGDFSPSPMAESVTPLQRSAAT